MANPIVADGNQLILPGGRGGMYVFAAQGDFSSGTLQLQWSLDGGTTKTNVSGGSLAAEGVLGPLYIGSSDIYLDMSGSSSPSVRFTLDRIYQS